MQIGKYLEPDDWFSMDKYKSNFSKYYNYLIRKFAGVVNIDRLAVAIAESVTNLSAISCLVNIKKGITVSLKEIFDLCDEEPELKKIIDTVYPDTMSFKEQEDNIEERIKEFNKITLKHDASYADLIRGSGINKNQFKQVVCNIGPRPSLDGSLIPNTVNTNFLRGLRNIQDFYILAEAARKVLIITHKNVKSSGYLTRKLSLLMANNFVDTDVEDCGTEFLLDVFITDQDILSRYEHRYYLTKEMMDAEDYEFKVLTADDTHLIGNTIYLRSPITCCAKHVCKKCYGKLIDYNKDYHAGILAVLALTSQLTQKLLSAKHLLQTNSPDLVFHDKFNELFIIDKMEVFAKEDINPKEMVYITPSTMQQDEETGESFVEEIGLIVDDERETIDMPEMLYLSEDLLDDLKMYKNNDEYEIPLKKFIENPIFYFKLQNEEITSSLNKIKNLIEKDSEIQDYSEFNQAFINLLSSNGIHLDAVHAEMLIHTMIRSKADPQRRPDFTGEDVEPYDILKVETSIFNNPLSASLSFEGVKNQLLDPDLLKKDDTSMLDIFFKS